MGERDEQAAQERARIERELKEEMGDLAVGADADEVIGGVTSTSPDPTCGPVAS